MDIHITCKQKDAASNNSLSLNASKPNLKLEKILYFMVILPSDGFLFLKFYKFFMKFLSKHCIMHDKGIESLSILINLFLCNTMS